MSFDPDKITKEHVRLAIEKIEKENIVLEPSTKYDVLINGKAYPPKEVMRYAHFIMNGEKTWSLSGGGPTNKYLRGFGFGVKKKDNTTDLTLDQGKFEELLEKYLAFCNRSHWLDRRESYKFKFAEWLSERVDLTTQSDEAILDLCIDSQEQYFRPESTERGINFIKSGLQFNDTFIAISDIHAIRELSKEMPEYESELLRMKTLSYPKLSVWLGTLLPGQYFIVANEELTGGLAYLFNQEKYPSSRFNGFVFAQTLLKKLYSAIFPKYADGFGQLSGKIGKKHLSDADKVWFVQDFILFINRRILDPNPAYWWVCQGNNFDEEFNDEEIKAPDDSPHHHKRLKDLQEGDHIIHYSKGSILALSKVVQEFQIRPLSSEQGASENWIFVKVSIQTIKRPIEIREIQERLLTDPDALPKSYSPINKNWDVNQGYLFPFTKRGYDILFGTETIAQGHIDATINNENIKDMSTKYELNTILYGPPGTGKTYTSIDIAVKIAKGESTTSHKASKKIFDDLRKEGQIEFVTFHQNYSYEDFIIGIKPDLAATSQLQFKRSEGVFYKLCKRAEQNYTSSKEAKDVLRPFEDVLAEFLRPLQEKDEEIEIKMASEKTSFWITDINPSNLSFRKQSGGTHHSLSLDTMKELYEGTREYTSGLRYYYVPLLDKLWELGKQKRTKVELKKFVLIIDEINRANISKVFGELITLLEADKRIDGENELRVTLPNGDREFGIPPNLFIIGTMNTADKSIALIDIALRRRFEFIGKYPQKNENISDEAWVLLAKINQAIYQKKNSADYLIGHAYFMNGNPIKVTLKNKVIPLLTEYFSGKANLVSDIFSGTGLSVTYNSATYEWDIEPEPR